MAPAGSDFEHKPHDYSCHFENRRCCPDLLFIKIQKDHHGLTRHNQIDRNRHCLKILVYNGKKKISTYRWQLMPTLLPSSTSEFNTRKQSVTNLIGITCDYRRNKFSIQLIHHQMEEEEEEEVQEVGSSRRSRRFVIGTIRIYKFYCSATMASV